MKIENLITMKKKRDQRQKFIRMAVWGLLVGSFGSLYVLDRPQTPPRPLQQTIEVKAVEVTPTPPEIKWNDAIRQIFPADEAGRMIRICLKESGNKYAINWNKNGTFDYSWCQINSCHKPKGMTDAEWKKNLDDPTFHAQQVRKIYLSQGWNAWVVYQKGYAK